MSSPAEAFQGRTSADALTEAYLPSEAIQHESDGSYNYISKAHLSSPTVHVRIIFNLKGYN